LKYYNYLNELFLTKQLKEGYRNALKKIAKEATKINESRCRKNIKKENLKGKNNR